MNTTILFQIICNFVVDDSFHDFVDNWKKAYMAIIGDKAFGSFLGNKGGSLGKSHSRMKFGGGVEK